MTTRLEAGADGVSIAAHALRQGRLVAFPTETVYGLGGDATNDRAVARIFDAKHRPRFNPLIIHVAGAAAAAALVRWNGFAERLADRFWPGPLSLVLPLEKADVISRLATAGGDTLALRCPAHPLALALIKEAARPVAAPSANPAGRLSPTSADHVQAAMAGRVDFILDGGPCAIGVESTVVDLCGPTPRLLRPGGLTTEALEAVLGCSLGRAGSGTDRVLRSPGQLSSHYAPRHPVRMNATSVEPDEALLAFGPVPLKGASISRNLSPAGDLQEAAANLFAMLHDLDRQDIAGIAVMPIPSVRLGEAIEDRLKRAAVREEDGLKGFKDC